jgi:hemerythrin-like domain-containing protein
MKENQMNSNAQNRAISAVLNEHGKLSAIIQGMSHFSKLVGQPGTRMDLKVFRAMLFYISEYPEKVHHPKEDEFLFRLVRARSADIDTTLLALEEQHHQGEAMVRELEHSLLRLEFAGLSALPEFQQQVERYAELYLQHMRLEEEVVVPAAERLLTDADWIKIDAAFSTNVDPLDRHDARGSFDRLYSMIVNITPAPYGLGDELK